MSDEKDAEEAVRLLQLRQKIATHAAQCNPMHQGFAESLCISACTPLTASMTFSRAQLKKKFGGLPNQKALMERRMRGGAAGGRKYFDSADWATQGADQSQAPPAPAAAAGPAAELTGEAPPEPEKPPPIH